MGKTTKIRQTDGLLLACTLSTPALRRRKDTLLAQLGERVIGKRALAHGYAYQFKGSDDTLGHLVDFIRSERVCCSFFDFSLQVKAGGSPIKLTITGPEGVKEFLNQEIGWG